MIGIKALVSAEGSKLYDYVLTLKQRGYVGFCMIFDSMDFILFDPLDGFKKDIVYKDVHAMNDANKFQYMLFEFDKPAIYGDAELVSSINEIFNTDVRLVSEYTDHDKMDLDELKSDLKFAIEQENYELCSKLQVMIKKLEDGGRV